MRLQIDARRLLRRARARCTHACCVMVNTTYLLCLCLSTMACAGKNEALRGVHFHTLPIEITGKLVFTYGTDMRQNLRQTNFFCEADAGDRQKLVKRPIPHWGEIHASLDGSRFAVTYSDPTKSAGGPNYTIDLIDPRTYQTMSHQFSGDLLGVCVFSEVVIVGYGSPGGFYTGGSTTVAYSFSSRDEKEINMMSQYNLPGVGKCYNLTASRRYPSRVCFSYIRDYSKPITENTEPKDGLFSYNISTHETTPATFPIRNVLPDGKGIGVVERENWAGVATSTMDEDGEYVAPNATGFETIEGPHSSRVLLKLSTRGVSSWNEAGLSPCGNYLLIYSVSTRFMSPDSVLRYYILDVKNLKLYPFLTLEPSLDKGIFVGNVLWIP